jgi:hypothetical protein
MSTKEMKRTIGKVTCCTRCGEKAAKLISRTKGTAYFVNIIQELPGGDAICGVADFHSCNPVKLAAFRDRLRAATVNAFTGIVTLFKTCASKGAKRMTITVANADARLTFSYKAGRDVLYVTNGEGYGHPDNRYYGAIVMTDGSFRTGREALNPAGADLLAAFNMNPVAVAVASARFTGSCSFCQRTLTDERSISVGYGPTCAENYGLPWGNAAAA